jgi:hypothetical protein
MGGVISNITDRRDFIASQNRAEELLLDLIYERVVATKPPTASELGEAANERYEGYLEGWWDAVEALRQVINNHTEGNGYRK